MSDELYAKDYINKRSFSDSFYKIKARLWITLIEYSTNMLLVSLGGESSIFEVFKFIQTFQFAIQIWVEKESSRIPFERILNLFLFIVYLIYI